MDRDARHSLAAQLAAAQDWWREAGVDCAFADEPANWLDAKPEPAAAVRAAHAASAPRETAPPAPAIGGDPAGWPQDLAAFAAWWLAEPSLDTGGASPRVPPRGPAGAKLMALVAEPEKDDREQLLGGEQGRLLANFLAKAGLTESEVYLASALPRHTPAADWKALRSAGLGKVVLYHIALAGPERVLLLGNDVTALLGNNPPQNPAFLLNLNHQGGSVRALAARSLDHMLRIPSARSRFWRDWLDWTDGTA